MLPDLQGKIISVKRGFVHKSLGLKHQTQLITLVCPELVFPVPAMKVALQSILYFPCLFYNFYSWVSHSRLSDHCTALLPTKACVTTLSVDCHPSKECLPFMGPLFMIGTPFGISTSPSQPRVTSQHRDNHESNQLL